MAGLPLLKLSSLLIKTISKPLGTRLKFEASRFPTFYKASVSVGQTSHYLSSRINVFASGYKFLGVKPLPADEAMEMGVSYLADGIVIFLGATIIVIEYTRGEIKNKLKAEKAAIAEAEFKSSLDERFTNIERKIQEIENNLPLMQQVLLMQRDSAEAMLIAIRGDRDSLKASQALAAVGIIEEQKEEEDTSASTSTDKNEKVPTG